jgi:hypothetical protein
MNADKGFRQAPADFVRPTAAGHRRGDGRRAATHARTSRRRTSDRGNSFAAPSPSDRPADARRRWPDGDPWIGRPDPPRPAAEPPAPEDDYPSWPGRPGPAALHPDHPSWPGRPGPDWAATEAALRADDYPSWPEGKVPPWRDPEPPRAGNEAPGWSGGGRSAAPREPPPASPGGPRWPAERPGPVLSAPVRTDLAPRADRAPPGPVLRGRATQVVYRPERPPVWDAGSAQLAGWIISEANSHAAEIRHETRDQVATSLAGAKQEAAQLIRQASDQAAATLEAAELQAAEIRATVMKLSGELGGVAAYVTQNLIGYAPSATRPAIPPAIQPVTRPVPEPAAEPKTLPAARPAAKPGTKHAAKPAAKPKPGPAAAPRTRAAATPNARPRQLMAIRVMSIFAAALFSFALIAGTTEVALHGFRFFVFRSAGTGETPGSGLQEDQGPGQPDAPGAHK